MSVTGNNNFILKFVPKNKLSRTLRKENGAGRMENLGNIIIGLGSNQTTGVMVRIVPSLSFITLDQDIGMI